MLTVDLLHSHFSGLSGVYVVWHGGPSPATVYVGQGNISERISHHRSSTDILKYSHLGLFVTWAHVPINLQDGVERFLADQLKPKEGSIHPHAQPVAVNFPW